jgi:hypothetical protein
MPITGVKMTLTQKFPQKENLPFRPRWPNSQQRPTYRMMKPNDGSIVLFSVNARAAGYFATAAPLGLASVMTALPSSNIRR